MARAGKKVLVLEQHDQAGGCCHTFVDKGFEFDIGIHYIGQMHAAGMNRIFCDVVTDGQLEWSPIAKNFDTVVLARPSGIKKFPLKYGKDEMPKSLIDSFPKHRQGITDFFKQVEICRGESLGPILLKILPLFVSKLLVSTGMYSAMTRYFSLSAQTLRSVLDRCFGDDEDIKTVVSYCFGDYGVVPEETPLVIHAALLNHYRMGAYYPEGGASEIAASIIPVIERSGGAVMVRGRVTEVLTDSSQRANGVRVQKIVAGKASGTPVELRAKVIISDAGAINTINLLPEPARPLCNYFPLIQDGDIKSGASAIQLFVGFDGTNEELQLPATNFWTYFGKGSLSQMLKEYEKLPLAEAVHTEVPMLFISFPSTKDPLWDKKYPGKSNATIISLAPYHWFEEWEEQRCQHRDNLYNEQKQQIAGKMWEQFLRIFPHLEGRKVYEDIGTPLSHRHYLDAPQGEIYGLHHDVYRFTPRSQMLLRPDTGIKGLYLTGQDVLCCGFVGALYGGLICASEVLNRSLHNDLMKLHSHVRKQLKADEAKPVEDKKTD